MRVGDDLECEIFGDDFSLNPVREWAAFVYFLRDCMPFYITESPLIFESDGSWLGVPAFDSPESAVAVAFFVDRSRVSYYAKVANSASESAAELEVWRDAIRRASQRLQEEFDPHPWWSLVGQVGDHQFPSVRLVEPLLESNGVRLTNTKKPHSEQLTNRASRSLGRTATSTSYPVIVQGMCRAPNWPMAYESAVIHSNRVAATLSLLSGAPWQMREAPRPDGGDEAGYDEWGTGLHEDGFRVHLMAEDVSVGSADFESVMRELQGSALVRRATYMHWQGTLVEDTSASLSFVAHVSSLEVIGRQVGGPASNESGKNFRQGVQFAHSDAAEVSAVMDAYDEYRNKIVHAGYLFGGEEVAGAAFAPASIFLSSFDDMRFRVGPLRLVRRASCSAIRQYSRGKRI